MYKQLILRNTNLFLRFLFIPFLLDVNVVQWVIMVMHCLERKMIANDAVALCQSKATTFHPIAS